MEVFLDNRQSEIPIDEKILDSLILVVKEALRLEGLEEEGEVSISFVNNSEIKTLNKDYRNIDKVTDVLSFPVGEDDFFPVRIFGDIIISAERALQQSKEYNHSLERELSYLTCHSMFHLLGYDHMNKNDKLEMRGKEKKVMENLNILREDKEDEKEYNR